MAHKLTSNSSVIYNAETQASGTLQITPEQVIYQNDGGTYHNVSIQCPIKVSGSDNYVGGVYYNVSETDWNNFVSSSTLTSTNEFDKQEELSLYYVKDQIDGQWGLSKDDWTYSVD